MISHEHNAVPAVELRQFGLIFGGLVMVLFGLLFPALAGTLLKNPLPWAIGGAVIGLALVWPRSLRPLYRAWMKFGEVAGWINTRIILFLLFYVIVFPVGLLMKLFGNDPLHRRADASAASYRVKQPVRDKSHMERPY